MTTTELPLFPFTTPPGMSTDPEGLRMLDAGPVGQARMINDGQEIWLALGYQANRVVLSDIRFSRERAMRPGGPVTLPAAVGITDSITAMDPPRHTRVRRLVAKAFTARMIERLEPRIRDVVDELLDEMATQSQPADLKELVVGRMPIIVICELLGVPVRDRGLWRHWAEGFASFDAPPEHFARIHRETAEYLAGLVATKRADPGDDLTTALVEVHDEDGDRLTEPELLIQLKTLVVAGHDTTASQLSNGIVALTRNPDQFDLLRADPSLAPLAVEELLRWDKLVMSTMPRVATEDVDVDGHVIPAGAAVISLPHIANRDPAVFDDPHRLDIHRPNASQHIAFTHGAHFCLGATLARTEMRIGLESLSRRFPNLEIAVEDDDLRWTEGRITRSLAALPVKW